MNILSVTGQSPKGNGTANLRSGQRTKRAACLFPVTIHGVKCLVLQSHDLHAGRLQQSPSSYQDDHERCAAFRPARLHFLRLFYLTLTRSRGTVPLPLPDSHPSAVSMHSSRSIHSSCMSPRSSAVLRSTAHTQRFQTDRIPSSCSLRL